MSPRLALAFLLVLSTLVALVAWRRSGSDAPGGAGRRSDRSSAVVSPQGWPRLGASADGVQVEVARPPRRVVTSTARALEFVCELIEPARVAAIPDQAIEYGALEWHESDFENHPRFAVYQAEAVLAFEPDLVVADTWQAADTHQRLREAGVCVLVLGDVSNWAQARAVIELLGHVLGAEQRAASLIAEFDLRVERLLAQQASGSGPKAMAYSNFGAEGFTCGRGTSLDEIMRLAGLTNAAEAAGLTGHASVSYEQLLTIDPELIVVSRPIKSGKGAAGDRGGAAAELLTRERALASLRAVKSNSLISLPAGLYASASHRIVVGAEILAAEVAIWRAKRLQLTLQGAAPLPLR
jgi:iron complex transport system substrate-binding protein